MFKKILSILLSLVLLVSCTGENNKEDYDVMLDKAKDQFSSVQEYDGNPIIFNGEYELTFDKKSNGMDVKVKNISDKPLDPYLNFYTYIYKDNEWKITVNKEDIPHTLEAHPDIEPDEIRDYTIGDLNLKENTEDYFILEVEVNGSTKEDNLNDYIIFKVK